MQHRTKVFEIFIDSSTSAMIFQDFDIVDMLVMRSRAPVLRISVGMMLSDTEDMLPKINYVFFGGNA